MALPIFTDKYGSDGPVINTSRWLKYIFLSFAQAVFNQYDEFKWVPDRNVTKVIIQDKYVSSTNIEKVPQIVFNRGPIRWVRISTDSTLTQETWNVSERKKQADLARCSASFTCIASDPTTSEHLADLLWLALFSYRELFKPKGIRFLDTVEIGECNPIEVELNNTSVERFGTPIFFSFDYQLLYEKNVNVGGRTVAIPTTLLNNVFPVVSGVGTGSTFDYTNYNGNIGVETNIFYEYYKADNNYLDIGELEGPLPVAYIVTASGLEYEDYVQTISGLETVELIQSGYFTMKNPVPDIAILTYIDLTISGFPGDGANI